MQPPFRCPFGKTFNVVWTLIKFVSCNISVSYSHIFTIRDFKLHFLCNLQECSKQFHIPNSDCSLVIDVKLKAQPKLLHRLHAFTFHKKETVSKSSTFFQDLLQVLLPISKIHMCILPSKYTTLFVCSPHQLLLHLLQSVSAEQHLHSHSNLVHICSSIQLHYI